MPGRPERQLTEMVPEEPATSLTWLVPDADLLTAGRGEDTVKVCVPASAEVNVYALGRVAVLSADDVRRAAGFATRCIPGDGKMIEVELVAHRGVVRAPLRAEWLTVQAIAGALRERRFLSPEQVPGMVGISAGRAAWSWRPTKPTRASLPLTHRVSRLVSPPSARCLTWCPSIPEGLLMASVTMRDKAGAEAVIQKSASGKLATPFAPAAV